MPPSNNKNYLSLVIRRWWVIIIAVALAGGLSYGFRQIQDPSYQAEAKVFIGNALSTLNPDRNLFDSSERLATTYAEVVRFSIILQPVIDNLDLELTLPQLQSRVSTRVLRDTPILAISVTLDDQDQVAEVANAIADSLIANSPADLNEDQIQQMDIQSQQIDALNAQVTTAREELIEVGNARSTTTDPDALALLDERYNTLIDQINAATANIAQLQSTFLPLSDRSNKIQMAEPATRPLRPTGISAIIVAVAGAMVGGILAVAVILFFAYIDDKIRDANEARNLLQLPVLGQIKRSRQLHKVNFAEPTTFNTASGYNVLAEQFRTVQANLLLGANARQRPPFYVVVSPEQGEGRTCVAANLAVVAAQAGLEVLLIDADLRHAHLHERFGLDNSRGVVQLLTEVGNDTATLDAPQDLIDTYLQHIDIPHLCIITSGLDDEAQALNDRILSFDHLNEVLQTMLQVQHFDFVMIDSPPSNAVADSYVLAGEVKANAVLVIQNGRTTQESALRTRDQFNQIGIHIAGVVINKT